VGGEPALLGGRMTPEPTLTDEELLGYEAALVPPRLIAALRASQAEVERLRRLCGVARMTMDALAVMPTPLHSEAAIREEAGRVAQRIVDEVGHSVTDEPALGPELRDENARLLAELDQALDRAGTAEMLVGYYRGQAMRFEAELDEGSDLAGALPHVTRLGPRSLMAYARARGRR
jgi:hypothetical protein